MDGRAAVGSTVVITGELSAHEDVVIAGRVEGLINVSGHLVTVQAGAQVVGDIQWPYTERDSIGASASDVADGAVVCGRVETVAETAASKLKAVS